MSYAVVIRRHCAVCKAVGELADMLEPHSGVHLHRGVCWEAWIEATESQRIEWAVSLFREHQPPGASTSCRMEDGSRTKRGLP